MLQRLYGNRRERPCWLGRGRRRRGAGRLRRRRGAGLPGTGGSSATPLLGRPTGNGLVLRVLSTKISKVVNIFTHNHTFRKWICILIIYKLVKNNNQYSYSKLLFLRKRGWACCHILSRIPDSVLPPLIFFLIEILLRILITIITFKYSKNTLLGYF